MAQEIRKETDWLGREKDAIYEDGTKVGETRCETTFWGNPINRTYDSYGNRVSETRHETTLFGTSKEVTYDTHGNKVSETRYEEGIFGGKRGVIYEDGNKIGEIKTEKGLFGRKSRVLHESSGTSVDLSTRSSRTSSSGGGGGGEAKGCLGCLGILVVGGIVLFSAFRINHTKCSDYKNSVGKPVVEQKDESFKDNLQPGLSYQQSNNQNIGYGDAPCADAPAFSESIKILEPNLDEIISSGVPYQHEDRGSYEPVETTSTSLDYLTPEIKLNLRIIDSIYKFIEPSDVVDMHDGSVAVKLGEGVYHRVDSYRLDEMNHIYEGYCQIAENAAPNRYRSRKMFEESVKKNLKTDLRRVIIRCEKIEEDYRLTMR